MTKTGMGSSEWDWDISRPTPKQEPAMSGQEYLLSRGIPQHLIDKHTLTSMYRFYGEHQPAVGFPYLEEAIKWRSTNRIKAFSQENVCRDFYLLDTYVSGNDILICEGEMDALSWKASGLPDNVTVLSVPSGAPAKVSKGKVDPQEDKKFQFIWRAKKQLASAKRIYLNTDDDEPGRALREEISRRIGRAKTWITTLDGCKDAGDALDKMGADFLVDCFHHSEPLPMLGLHAAEDYADPYISLYENGRMKGALVGIPSVDRLFSVPLGMLSIVTGFPGSGKSDLIDQFCVNLAQDQGWKTCYCSFEKPPDMHMAQLAQKFTGKSFFEPEDPTSTIERMTPDERDHAFTWIREHFMFMDSSTGGPTDIAGILDVASAAVMRMGCRVLVIDPYNFISVERSGGLETDTISDMLTDIQRWAREHDCHVFFVAHPSKPKDAGGSKYVCGGNDVSKSAAWFAKADLGLTTWRGEGTHNELHVWKCRWAWMGTIGRADLAHTSENSRWVDASFVPDDYDWDF